MNNVTLVGRLTKEPELRRTKNGTACTTFTLAVNRTFKTADGIEADFIQIVSWGKTAENVHDYTYKGMRVGVIGRIQTRTYTKNDGSNVYITEVVANEVQFLEQRQQNDQSKYYSTKTVDIGENFDNNYNLRDDDIEF